MIGVQQPEGDTCWVYTDQSDAGDSAGVYCTPADGVSEAVCCAGTLWDPAKGNRFAVTDKLCPLKQVIMLFNNQNLWVNIQVPLTLSGQYSGVRNDISRCYH